MTIVWSPTSTTDLNSTSQYNPTAYRKLTQTRKTTVSRNMIYTCISMFMLAFWRGYIGIKWIDWNAECIHLFIYKICIHNMYIYTSSRYIYILYQYLYLYGFALYIYIILSILYLSLVGGSVHVFFIFNQRHEVISIPDQGISQVNWSGGKLFALGAQGR